MTTPAAPELNEPGADPLLNALDALGTMMDAHPQQSPETAGPPDTAARGDEKTVPVLQDFVDSSTAVAQGETATEGSFGQPPDAHGVVEILQRELAERLTGIVGEAVQAAWDDAIRQARLNMEARLRKELESTIDRLIDDLTQEHSQKTS